MAGGIGGAAAGGLQSGFQLGLQATAQQDARDQRAFENARQTAADSRQAAMDARNQTRQDTSDANAADDRALTGLNSDMEDTRFQLGALHAKYPDGQVPDAEARPIYTRAQQIHDQRSTLLAKRYQPIIDAETQKWRDFSSRAQAGDPNADPSALRGDDLRQYIRVSTGHDLADFANGTVGKSINDATAGLGSGNMPMVINAADTLLAPQIKKNLGAVAPDGSQIIDKSLYALVPAPAGGMQSGQQNPALSANPVQGLQAALGAAMAPAGGPPAGGATSTGSPPVASQPPQGAPEATGGPPPLQPGDIGSGLVMPVLQVTTRQPDGRITSYHAPVTDGRGAGGADSISGPLQTSDLMDRMGRLGVVDNWLKTPQMAAAVQDALKSSAPTSFDQAWATVHGDPKALLATGATDVTSQKIAAIKKLATEQYGGDFSAASQALTGKVNVPSSTGVGAASAPTGAPATAPAPAGSPTAPAGGVRAAMMVSPADQAARDKDQLGILQRERTAIQQRLAAGSPGTSPADLTAIDKEIANTTKQGGGVTGAMTQPTKAQITKKTGTAALSPEQNQALFGPHGAVTEGRLDMNRVNSRTAGLLADAELTNPGSDFAAKSGDIQLARNATFRQKAQTAEALPEIMQNMVDAGKKVNFSNLEPIGQMEAWVLGKTNDPDLTTYMTQRNDALMTIAGVMRGVGMTDKAHQAEIEVAKPTMSPQALDAWMKGQMASLAPRLRINRGVIHNAPGSGVGGAAPAPATAPRAFSTEAEAAAAGLPPGTKITIGGRSGTWQ